MDSQLRKLERAARMAGSNSPEDVGYIYAQAKAGVLSPNVLELTSFIGDASSNIWLRDTHKIPASEPTITIDWENENTDVFAEALIEQITALEFPITYQPFPPIVSWLQDCIIRLLTLIWNIQTGRGGYLFRVTSDAQPDTVNILSQVSAFQEGRLTLKKFISIARRYCQKYEHIPLGIRDNLDCGIAAMTCNLLQAIVSWNRPQELVSSSGLPEEASSWYLFRQAIEDIDNVTQLIFQRRPYPTKPRRKQLLELQFQFRKVALQNLADIFLNRPWGRPELPFLTERPPLRHNPDDELRRLERLASTGDSEAIAALLKWRLRIGTLSEGSLVLPARLGHPIAQQLLGQEVIPEPWVRQISGHEGKPRIDTSRMTKLLAELLRQKDKAFIVSLLMAYLEHVMPICTDLVPTRRAKFTEVMATARHWLHDPTPENANLFHQRYQNLKGIVFRDRYSSRFAAPDPISSFMAALDHLSALLRGHPEPWAHRTDTPLVIDVVTYHAVAIARTAPSERSHRRIKGIQKQIAEYQWQANYLAEELLGIPHQIDDDHSEDSSKPKQRLKRRNPDDELRRLERLAATGDTDAQAQLLSWRLRIGQVQQLVVETAAKLGHPAARQVIGMSKEAPNVWLDFHEVRVRHGQDSTDPRFIVDVRDGHRMVVDSKAIRELLSYLVNVDTKSEIVKLLTNYIQHILPYCQSVLHPSIINEIQKILAAAVFWADHPSAANAKKVKRMSSTLYAQTIASPEVPQLDTVVMLYTAIDNLARIPRYDSKHQLLAATRSIISFCAGIASVSATSRNDLSEYEWQANYLAEELLGIPHQATK